MTAKEEAQKKQLAMVKKRYDKTLGSSKGVKPPPKPKVSLKGTNPLKKKVAVTVTKKF